MSTLYVDTINEKTSGNGIEIPGHVLQVKSVHKSDTFSTSSLSFVDVTGLSVSITPKSTSSKILVISDIALGVNINIFSYYRILRDSTAINIGDASTGRVSLTGMAHDGDNAGIVNRQSSQFIDSPATTSSVTYKIQARSATSGTTYINQGSRDLAGTDYDTRQASSLILMEIGG